MSNPEHPNESDSFEEIALSQKTLEELGLYFFAVPREHTEGLVTRPLISRIRRKIKQVGFERLAGNSLITFSGFRYDPREIHQIPEIRAFWRKLDADLLELPSLLAAVPLANYNGPVQHLSLLGQIDQIIDHPEKQRQDLHVVGADKITKQAVDRIIRAGVKHQLNPDHIAALVHHFISSTEFPQPK